MARGSRAQPEVRPGTRPGRRSRLTRGLAGASRPAARRPRLTGRFAVLVLVLAVLAVSYASSLRAHLEQRAHIASLEDSIARSEAAISELEREKRRWEDPEYLQQQAGRRFGWVMPGEVAFRVLDHDGRPLDQVEELSDPPAQTTDDGLPLWWQETLTSLAAAGHPDSPAAQGPAEQIRPPRQRER